MTEPIPGQWEHDNASPEDDEHRKDVEDRKQATKDEKFDEWENSHERD